MQARRLPRKIARFAPDAIWTSPLLRASVVAGRAARLTGAPLRVEDRLIELDFGSAHALNWEEISAAGIPFDYRSAEHPVAPGGESRNDLERRVGLSSLKPSPWGADTSSSVTRESCGPRSRGCWG